MLEQFKKTGKEALADLKKVNDLASLEEFRIKYLSRKGQVMQMLSQIGKLPPEEKPQAGQLANKIKKEVTSAFEKIKSSLVASQQTQTKEIIDVTLPGRPVSIGKPHVITQTLNELLEIFELPLDRKVKGYSKGMKQMLGIIQAFMDDPDMVIMD